MALIVYCDAQDFQRVRCPDNQVSVMFCTTELFLLMTIFILNEHSLIFLQITLQEIVSYQSVALLALSSNLVWTVLIPLPV